jgi:hypothetical protein
MKMRQILSQKKVNKLRLSTGLDIVKVMVRGGTDHRKDLCISDGSIICLHNNGNMIKSTSIWDNKKNER